MNWRDGRADAKREFCTICSPAAQIRARRLTWRRSSSANCAPACGRACFRPRSRRRSTSRSPQIQRCQLLVGDLDEVAVLAKNNALDVARFRLFHPIQFMLATPQETAELAAETLGGRTFFAEDKLDGIRAQIHKSGDRIAIYTRTMDRTDESFPDVVDADRRTARRISARRRNRPVPRRPGPSLRPHPEAPGPQGADAADAAAKTPPRSSPSTSCTAMASC